MRLDALVDEKIEALFSGRMRVTMSGLIGISMVGGAECSDVELMHG
mgnify:CR=1 FL=1